MSKSEAHGYICAMNAILDDGGGLEAAVMFKLQALSDEDCGFKTGWIRACEEYVR